jgi:hypothetical protein
LQGVADVEDNALIMRFKFTAKPNIPSLIQREAMKRMFAAFRAAGIEFATSTVSVQAVGGQSTWRPRPGRRQALRVSGTVEGNCYRGDSIRSHRPAAAGATGGGAVCRY